MSLNLWLGCFNSQERYGAFMTFMLHNPFSVQSRPLKDFYQRLFCLVFPQRIFRDTFICVLEKVSELPLTPSVHVFKHLGSADSLNAKLLLLLSLRIIDTRNKLQNYFVTFSSQYQYQAFVFINKLHTASFTRGEFQQHDYQY